MSGKERKSQFAGRGIQHATINHHRFHLRPLPEGGLLWLNGQQPPYHLDKTATDFVSFTIEAMWQFQQGDGDESARVADYVVDKMLAKYRRPLALRNRLTRQRVKADLDRIFGALLGLAEGACPVELGLSGREIKSASWTAPARMDLAITYRCNLDCAKCYNGETASGSELSTEQWREIFRLLWEIGIPQVVFTGGEPTLREDLVELVEQAEEFVTGLVTNGTRLKELAAPLHQASLDYAQITLESHDPNIHDQMTGVSGSQEQTLAGLKQAQAVGIQVVTNTTLTRLNAPSFCETMSWLKNSQGVENIACNTLICSGRGTQYKVSQGLSDDELKVLLDQACRQAEKLGVNFQWYSPGCYTGLNPLDLGLGAKHCSAASHNMLIQPDGTVLPCQSWPETVGNIRTDPWQKIWNHPTCRKLRDHLLASPECSDCGHFADCGGGCPLDKAPRHSAPKGGAA
jgi:radical SAM protein with 4Fe4S-binding SPASM domain